MADSDKSNLKFLNINPIDKSDRPIHVFATLLGLFSVLCALIIGFVSYKYSIQITDTQFKVFYLNKVTMILHAAKSSTFDSTRSEFINNVKTYYLSLKNNPPDEYISITDSDGNILFHSLIPGAVGKNVGESIVYDIDNEQNTKLKDVITQNKSFVGDYISIAGQPQIAAFVPVQQYDLLFGIHRAKSSIKKNLYAGINLMMWVFIFICGGMMPAALLILFHTVKISDRRNKEIDKMRAFMEFCIDHATIAAFIISSDSTIIYANEAASRLLGYPKEKIISKKVLDLITIYNEDTWKPHFDQLREKKVIVYESEFPDKKYNKIPVEVHANYLMFGGQEFDIAFAQNISERKKKDMEIMRIQKQQKAILDNIPDITWLKDTQGRYLTVNESFAKTCGLSVEEIIGKTDFDIFPEQIARMNICDDEEVVRLKIRKFIDQPIITKDGEEKFMTSFKTPVYNESGEIIATTGSARDITDRKKMEKALIWERDYSASIIRQTPAIICSLKIDGTINFINPAGEEITGYRSEELVGKNWWEIFYPQDAKEKIEFYRNQLISKDIRDTEMSIEAKDGLKKTILWNFIRRVESSGEISEIIGFGNDITNRIQMESELFKAKKLDSLSILAGGIAHDFNNLLTTILGNISLARMDADSDILQRAEQGALRAKELSRQLLTFSKGGAPVKKTLSIVDLVKETANFVLRGSKIKSAFSNTGGVCSSEIDEGQICQVINNLIINSMQSMPDGGTINIAVEDVILDQTRLHGITQKDFVRIVIQDQGIGIPEENLHKIFDPFFTTKEEGSGLGLSICYSIIKKHNGFIKVESESNKGTKFEIYLPSSSNLKSDSNLCPNQINESLSNTNKSSKKKKILIMDDDESVRILLSKALDKLGYETDTANDGDEVIKKYKRALELNNIYDAVIMDLTVPGGMGGKDAMEQLIKINPSIIAIVSSGYSNDPVIAEYEKYGFKSVIPKPYEMSLLNEVVTKVVG